MDTHHGATMGARHVFPPPPVLGRSVEDLRLSLRAASLEDRPADWLEQARELAQPLIKRFEWGYSERPPLKAYQCPGKRWTIGWGHTKGVKRGDTCTLEQAELWLDEDVRESMDAVHALDCELDYDLTIPQAAALISFAFNLGPHIFDRGRSRSVGGRLRRGNTRGAADGMLLYNRANKKVMAGLVKRRAAERDLFLRGAVDRAGVAEHMPQAVDEPDKPLTQSKTAAGAASAGAGWLLDVGRELLATTAGLPESVQWSLAVASTALILGGVAVVIHQRYLKMVEGD